MAWTQQDLDAIKAAIASGSKKVQYQDRAEEYHSLSEMLRIKKLIENELGLRRQKHVYPMHSRGHRSG